MIRTLSIGIKNINYNTLRNFAGVRMEGISYQKAYDLSKFIEYPVFKLFNKVPLLLHNVFLDHGVKGVDFFHFFNTIYFGRKNWLVTAEDLMPRIATRNSYLMRKCLDQLMADNCKHIFYMSHNAFQRQIHFLKDKFPAYLGLMDKSSVLYPPQQIFLDSLEEKPFGKAPLRFIFIGRHFFRKGGLEMLRAVQRLIENGYELHLTVISSLSQDSWYNRHVGSKEIREARAILSRHPSAIAHFMSVDNAAVLDLVKKSDVGLLPTYGETFGYSVLECQASGVPVVSTDIWALHEINSDQTGWILNVPKKQSYTGWTADADTVDKALLFSKHLENEIYRIMVEIISTPEQIKHKAANALLQIQKNHDPAFFQRKLQATYADCI